MIGSRALIGGAIVAAFVVSAGFAQAPAPAVQAPAAPASTVAPAGRGQQAPLPPALLSCPELSTALRGVAANDSRLRDWAQLGRYREANRTVGPVDVVFMGDSITDSWPQERFGPFFPGKRYLGRGISGQTTPQMLVRFRPDVLNLKPKVVIILAGTNDIAGNTGPMTDDEIQDNMASMAELATAAGVKVVFSSITPTAAYHAAPNGVPQTTVRPMERIRKINDWMKTYAAAHKHIYADYFSAMLDSAGLMKAEFTADDLHPNAAAYAVMAPIAQAAIDRAMR
jgi:lysophospholipase L1-like esterase